MIDQLGSFRIKTHVLFGRGGIADIGEIASDMGARSFLLVADPAVAEHGLLDPARKSLEQAGLSGKEYTGVEPEPYLDNADSASDLGKEIDADLVIGIGGGSAMDTAKAAAVLVTNEGRAADYVGLNLVPFPGVPTIMVPTTAGTGSEVTFTAVFTNRETKAKGGINSEFMFPDFALLDPDLTTSLPPDVTAATGMDALTHAIESVTSLSSTVFTEAQALTAIRLISANLRRAVYRGDDMEAREKMLLGSLLGGLALADAGVGACHAMAYPLGGLYRVPHGLANAVLIPYVMEFNIPAAEREFALIAESMGQATAGIPRAAAAAMAAEEVRALCRDIDIPQSLTELEIAPSDIPRLVQGALTVTRPVENNPRPLGEREAREIYERAFAE
jgi:alcohol dehydrogenase